MARHPLTTLWFCLLVSLCWGQLPELAIGELQGAGTISPYEGLRVRSQGNVVTAVGFDRFFMQSPPGMEDGDPLTSEGVAVVTGSRPDLSVGDVVTVEGRVLENASQTALGGDLLTVEVTATNAFLPAPVTLQADFPATSPAAVPDLERVEGMRVSFDGAFCGPTDLRGLAPLTAGGSRPMREPGIRWPGREGLPVWDGNPEIFWLDPNGLGQPNRTDIAAGQTISAVGILTQEYTDYVVLPSSYFVAGELQVPPVPSPGQDELIVASLNCLRFVPTAPDRITRARKLAAFIARQMRFPDVVALQEVGTASELDELLFYLKFEDPTVQYEPYLIPGEDQINVAYLVKNTLFGVIVTALGRDETFNGGFRVHDRPPLLLEALLADRPDLELSVLNLHMRSLNGIEGPDSSFVRRKRDAQARSVAQMVQGLQGRNLVVLGDFNAFPFTDGYVDVTNQIAGTPGLGALFPVQPIVSPPLINQTATLPSTEEQYSFVFEGTAQLLDNCLTTELPDFELSRLAFARGNADFPDFFASNPDSPLRASDHDGLALYLRARDLSGTAERGPEDPAIRFPNPIRPGDAVQWASAGPMDVVIYTLLGQPLWQARSVRQRFHWPVLPTAGVYMLRVMQEGRTLETRRVWSAGR